MGKLKHTCETWIMPLLTALMVAAAIVAVYLPQSRKLKSIKSTIAARRLVLEDNADKASVVPAMLRKVQDLKSRYKDFDSRLPRSKELGAFLKEITAIQQNSALVDSQMETGSPSSEELFNTMPIKMRVRGQYLALTEFLRRLSNMQRLTRIQRLIITRPPEEDSRDLNIELQMNIYFTKT